MANYKLQEIRSTFLDYFIKNDHIKLASSNLVPDNDPTLLFTNSGMVQFKNIFTGLEKTNISKAVTSQKCIRAGGKHNDLENVGNTARHHTFFEMLGNFSFGDYFKERAIYHAWELLTKVFDLPKNKLYITVFHEDEDAYKLWKNISGLSDNRIIKISTSDNFWSMGSTGPCGPCSEIFYDHGPDVKGGLPGTPEEDGDRYIEIWNLVFMQFEQVNENKRLNLPKPSIDTGMGLERISAVLQGTYDNYEIDLFKNLIRASSEVTKSNINDNTLRSHRVIADHIRSAAFLISEGVFPGNEGRNYVLRRILRRAIRHSNILGCNEIFLYKLVDSLVHEMGDAYPILSQEKKLIENTIENEELKFKETLERGLGILSTELNKKNTKLLLSGKKAFELYDTYGFPLDLTQDVLKNKGWKVDVSEFNREMENQKMKARQSWVGSGDKIVKLENLELLNNLDKTQFKGYEKADINTIVKFILKEGKPLDELKNNDEGQIIFKETIFYAESGGQVSDIGIVQNSNFKGKIIDCKKIKNLENNEIFIHKIRVISGSIKLNQNCNLQLDKNRRLDISSNHTCTHLLHETLREMFGEIIKQKGSLVNNEKLRFDFSYDKPLNEDQILTIEKTVNNKILEKNLVKSETMDIDEAKKKGAIALFGEKYDRIVRVVSIGQKVLSHRLAWSVELCGGTHLENTVDAGIFKIINETGVSSGIRRIEGVSRINAHKFLDKRSQVLTMILQKLNTSQELIEKKIEQIINENKSFKLEIKKLKNSSINKKETIPIIKIDDIKVSIINIDKTQPNELKAIAEKRRDDHDLDIICVITNYKNKISCVVSVKKGLTNIFNAVDLVNIIALKIGGKKGGGRNDMAQAGGQDVQNIDSALESFKNAIKKINSTKNVK